ncbi:hypothetical protein HNP46_000286 [Pseudomonas nitritireducens]|uniref:Uncharacterized protein n=1 Tax=Pseudomonas nitroreducens TaxID=46680 RepID=A0A7W7KEN9_PSENT|nr:hypothetical protein [Pseudomonas nitritireducens]MBB4861475.1 hypothetical protein [Pseudomonas nitritireducens]
MSFKDQSIEKILQFWARREGFTYPLPDNFYTWRHPELSLACESVGFDPTRITAALLCDGWFTDYVNDARFSIMEMVKPTSENKEVIKLAGEIYEFLSDPIIAKDIQDFEATSREAMVHYDVEVTQDHEAILSSHTRLGDLRGTAFKALTRLKIHQFKAGVTAPADVKPVFMKNVYRWWDTNSLLAAFNRLPNGVSLHAIKTPQAFEQYFIFAVRNGENYYLITDVAEHGNPIYVENGRRPDRDMHRRIGDNYLPYSLLDIKWDEEQGRLFETMSSSTALVAHQQEWSILSEVRNLPADSAIWVMMMFNLLSERFIHSKVVLPTLSYTGQQLETSLAQIQGRSSNLPVVLTGMPDVTTLTKDDIRPENCSEDELGASPFRINYDLVDLYGHMVSDEVLNIVNRPGMKTEVAMNSEGQMVITTDVIPSKDRKGPVVAVSAYISGNFGTKQQVENDRKFMARAAFAQCIGAITKYEFARRKKDVIAWFDERLQANLDNLMAYAGCQEIWVRDANPMVRGCRGQNWVATREHSGGSIHQFLHQVDAWAQPIGPTLDNKPLCPITGAKASTHFTFTPFTASDLAVMAGVSVADLPDVLQHWTLEDFTLPNSNLRRVDPVTFLIDNPWHDVNFQRKLSFSKRGMSQILKIAKTPPLDVVQYRDKA